MIQVEIEEKVLVSFILGSVCAHQFALVQKQELEVEIKELGANEAKLVVVDLDHVGLSISGVVE